MKHIFYLNFLLFFFIYIVLNAKILIIKTYDNFMICIAQKI